MDSQKLLSKTIDWLRFPLIVMVVFIHNPGIGDIPKSISLITDEGLSTSDFLNLTRMAFTKVIPTIAVPSFFLISGYLFFKQKEILNMHAYKEKITKRFHTLLIPYILWNIIYLLMPFLIHYGLGWHNPIHYTQLEEYISSVDWLRWIWDFSFINKYDVENWAGIIRDFTYPINFPLWYVRDLMVICLLTPVIYWTLKKLGIGAIITLSILYILGIWPNIHGLNISGLFFFCSGAFFAINGIDMISVFRKIEIPCYCASLLLLCFLIPNCNVYKVGVINLSTFYIIAGVVSIFNLVSRLLESGKIGVNKWLTSSVFFIFAFHANPLVKQIDYIIFPYKEGKTLSLFEYLITPFINIVICLIAYYLIKKWFPTILKVLMGYRK